jgi:hypothetical protein
MKSKMKIQLFDFDGMRAVDCSFWLLLAAAPSWLARKRLPLSAAPSPPSTAARSR